MARRKDKMVWASVDDNLRAWVEKQAAKQGLNVSSYVRRLLMLEKEKEESS